MMRPRTKLRWLAASLILIAGTLVVVLLVVTQPSGGERMSEDLGDLAHARSTEALRQRAGESRNRKSRTERTAKSLLAVAEGEVSMISLSGRQFEAGFGEFTPTFHPSLPCLVNVYSREQFEAGIQALLWSGEELGAKFAEANHAAVKAPGVAVHTKVIGTAPAGFDLELKIEADGGFRREAWTLKSDGVLVVRSLSDPADAILIFGPAPKTSRDDVNRSKPAEQAGAGQPATQSRQAKE